jgi:small subunit ribosomal protein S4
MVRNMPDNARQVRASKLKEKGEAQQQVAPKRKLSEYGKQLHEKQRVRDMYGLRERQFRRFFDKAVTTIGAPGENLLSFLERRLDNTLYRLKMAISRTQARQIIVHGHVRVNGSKVTSPSYLVSINDVISLKEQVQQKEAFLEQVIDKRLKTAIKVPEWLELNKAERKGIVLRYPVRSDIQAPIEEHLIVELYSK